MEEFMCLKTVIIKAHYVIYCISGIYRLLKTHVYQIFNDKNFGYVATYNTTILYSLIKFHAF